MISIAGNTAQLMDMKDFSNFEIPIPEDKKDHVEVGKEIVVYRIHGKEKDRLTTGTHGKNPFFLHFLRFFFNELVHHDVLPGVGCN